MSQSRKPWFSVAVLVTVLNVVFFLCYDLVFYRYESKVLYFSVCNPYLVLHEREYWRLITSLFFHFDIEHLLGNMLMLCYLGVILERTIGKIRWLILYFVSGVLANFASIYYNIFWEDNQLVMSGGASGAICGLAGALVMLILVQKSESSIMKKKELPIFVFFLLFVSLFEKGIGHAAHFGGFAAGMLIGLIFRLLDRKGKITKV